MGLLRCVPLSLKSSKRVSCSPKFEILLPKVTCIVLLDVHLFSQRERAFYPLLVLTVTSVSDKPVRTVSGHGKALSMRKEQNLNPGGLLRH
jgi:hypothetical protein